MGHCIFKDGAVWDPWKQVRAIVMKGAAEKSPGEKTAWGILRGFREITLGSADVNIYSGIGSPIST